jgi:hypothetical protein
VNAKEVKKKFLKAGIETADASEKKNIARKYLRARLHRLRKNSFCCHPERSEGFTFSLIRAIKADPSGETRPSG